MDLEEFHSVPEGFSWRGLPRLMDMPSSLEGECEMLADRIRRAVERGNIFPASFSNGKFRIDVGVRHPEYPDQILSSRDLKGKWAAFLTNCLRQKLGQWAEVDLPSSASFFSVHLPTERKNGDSLDTGSVHLAHVDGGAQNFWLWNPRSSAHWGTQVLVPKNWTQPRDCREVPVLCCTLSSDAKVFQEHVNSPLEHSIDEWARWVTLSAGGMSHFNGPIIHRRGPMPIQCSNESEYRYVFRMSY